jgi:hypothetical protein
MSDGTQGTSQMPFNVNSNIHTQTITRERIETHLAEQRVEREHRIKHTHLEILRAERLELRYDKGGVQHRATHPQGQHVDISI